MYLASGGDSKMSGSNAQILIGGPQVSLEHGEVCPVGGASLTTTNLCFILYLYYIPSCIFPNHKVNKPVCFTSATILS